MQMVSEVMTRNVRFVTPQENLQRAAQLMDELNVGALPVCDGDNLVGMVTDRDITVRGTAAGRAPTEARVEEVMSGDVRWCFEDQSLDEVMQQMADTQIRRVPVVSHDEQHKLIGIVALGDIATKASEGAQGMETQQLMEKISYPSEPDMSSQGTSAASGSSPASGKADMSGATGGTGGAASAGSMGYEGDIGLAGAAGATSNLIDETDESGTSDSVGDVGGASGGVAGTTGGAKGADLG